MAQRVNVRRLALFALSAVLVVAGVLLTSLPAQADMSGGKIRFRNGYIVLKFEHTGSAVHRRAFLRADFFSGGGYQKGPLRADYLLEDDTLYRFAGPIPTDWLWTPVATVTHEVDGTRVRWKVDQSLIERSCPFGLYAIFEIKKPRKTKTMPLISSIDSACPKPTAGPSNTYVWTLTRIPTLTPTPLLTPTPTPEKWPTDSP